MIFSTRKKIKIINWEQIFFVHPRIVSAVKRVEFVRDRLSYRALRGRWRNIIVVKLRVFENVVLRRIFGYTMFCFGH